MAMVEGLTYDNIMYLHGLLLLYQPPEGWKAELAWLVDPTIRSHVNHILGTDQRKSASQRPTF